MAHERGADGAVRTHPPRRDPRIGVFFAMTAIGGVLHRATEDWRGHLEIVLDGGLWRTGSVSTVGL